MPQKIWNWIHRSILRRGWRDRVSFFVALMVERKSLELSRINNLMCCWISDILTRLFLILPVLEKNRDGEKKMILIVIVKVEKFKMHFDQTVGDFLNFYSFFWFRKKICCKIKLLQRYIFMGWLQNKYIKKMNFHYHWYLFSVSI